jgi:hypothetical protein
MAADEVPTEHEGMPPRPRALVLAVAGGAVAILGTVLDWWTLSGTRAPDGSPTTDSGLNYLTGFGLAIISLIATVLVLIVWVEHRAKRRRWLAITALIIGSCALLISVYCALVPERAYQRSEARSAAEAFGTTKEQAGDALRQWLDTGELSIDAELGPFVATVGNASLVVGAAFLVAREQRERPEAEV